MHHQAARVYASWLTLAMVFLVATHAASAATLYWDGASSTPWSTASNWDTANDGSGGNPGGAPGSGDTAVFNTTALNATRTINVTGAQAVGGIIFRQTSSTTINAGNPAQTLSLGTGGVTVQSGANTATIGSTSATAFLSISLQGAQTWANNSVSTFTVHNNISIGSGGNQTLTLGGTGGSVVSGANGVISDGAAVLSLAKTGSGFVTVSGANTFTGSVTISGGTYITTAIANGGAASGLGQSSNSAANLIFDGGTLRYAGTAAGSTNRNFTVTGNGGTIEASGTTAGTLNISGGMTASASTGSQTLTLAGTGTGATGAGTLGGIIANGGGTNVTHLLKSGSGSWTISGANTFSGTTTATGGVLTVAAGAGDSTSSFNSAGGTINFSGNHSLAAKPVSITRGGVLAVDVSSTATVGDLSIGDAALPTRQSITLTATSNLTLGNTWTPSGTSTLQLNLPAGSALASTPASTNGVVTGGGGAYAIVTDSTATGFAAVSGGNVVRLTGQASLPTGATTATTNYQYLATTSGTGTGSANYTITTSQSMNTLTLVADNANASNRTFVLGSNTLSVGTGGILAIGSGQTTFTFSGAGGVGTTGQNLYIYNWKTASGRSLAFGTTVSGADIIIDGISSTVITEWNDASNDYTGSTNVLGGRLKLGATGVIPDTSDVYLGGTATMNVFTGTEIIRSLGGSGAINAVTQVANTTATLEITGSGTYSGVISDATNEKIALTKSTGGVQTMIGASTYRGATTVSGGRLNVVGSISANSAVTVNGTGTLSGTGSVLGTIGIDSGGSVAPGDVGTGTLTTGALTVNNNGTLRMQIDIGGNTSDRINVTGGLVINTGAVLELSLLNAGPAGPIGPLTFVLVDTTTGITGTASNFVLSPPSDSSFTYSTSTAGGDYSVTITAVPEPGASMLMIGAACLLTRRRSVRS